MCHVRFFRWMNKMSDFCVCFKLIPGFEAGSVLGLPFLYFRVLFFRGGLAK